MDCPPVLDIIHWLTGDNPLTKARGLSPRKGGHLEIINSLTRDSQLAKARGLSPPTGGQTMV